MCIARNIIVLNMPLINKELLIVPDAVHTDLYDGGGKDAIPFDKIESFLKTHLN